MVVGGAQQAAAGDEDEQRWQDPGRQDDEGAEGEDEDEGEEGEGGVGWAEDFLRGG